MAETKAVEGDIGERPVALPAGHGGGADGICGSSMQTGEMDKGSLRHHRDFNIVSKMELGEGACRGMSCCCAAPIAPAEVCGGGNWSFSYRQYDADTACNASEWLKKFPIINNINKITQSLITVPASPKRRCYRTTQFVVRSGAERCRRRIVAPGGRAAGYSGTLQITQKFRNRASY